MSEYRDKMALMSPSYENLQQLVEFSIAQRRAAYGWIAGKFYQAYPGGRTIDYTDDVARRPKKHCICAPIDCPDQAADGPDRITNPSCPFHGKSPFHKAATKELSSHE